MNRNDDTRVLKSDSFGRILLVRDDARQFVRRDLGATPWWLRLPAWWLARREARALQKLDGMEATPRLLGWDGRWLDRSYMAGAAMHLHPPRGVVPGRAPAIAAGAPQGHRPQRLGQGSQLAGA